MPGRDGSGPMGMGAMTGRGAGMCARVGISGYENAGPGRGFGMGYNRGRRNRFYATGQPGWMRFGGNAGPYQNPDSGMERQSLKNQAEELQSELNAIKNAFPKLKHDLRRRDRRNRYQKWLKCVAPLGSVDMARNRNAAMGIGCLEGFMQNPASSNICPGTSAGILSTRNSR